MSALAVSGGVRFRAGFRVFLLMSASALAACVTNQAGAQTAPAAPVRSAVDSNGVDLFNGNLTVSAPALTIGGADSGMSFRISNKGSGWTDSTMSFLNLSGSTMTVALGGVSDRFSVSGSTYTSTEGNGATLSLNGTTYTYTASDGTVAHFNQQRWNQWNPYGNSGLISDITYPNGEKRTYNYSQIDYCGASKAGSDGYICLRTISAYRINSIDSSNGYRLNIRYADYDYQYDQSDPLSLPDLGLWSTSVGVNALNIAKSGSNVISTQSYFASSSGGANYYTVTDNASGQYKFRVNGGRILGITMPGNSAETVTVGYDGSNRVSSITNAGGTTSYATSDSGSNRTVTVTDGNGKVSTYVFDLNSERMTSYVDAIGNATNDQTHHTTSYAYDGYGRVTQVTAPELNQTITQYDPRGNVTQVTQVAKPNTGLANVVTSAGYDASCTIAVKCNKPNWTKDALGNQTDYTYDPTHGGVLTVTLPAASAGAARPQTRYDYTAMQAFYDSGSGSIAASGQNTWKLTRVSVCRFTSGCVGNGDELRATIDYGPQSAGTGNNLQPVSKTVRAGDGTFGGTTSTSYDAVGNVSTTTDALGNTTVYHYDADRRLVGVVYPDPDGAGPRTPTARKYYYNERGAKWIDSVGTVTDQSDAAWNNYTETYHNYAQLDAYDRTVRTTVWTYGIDYAVSDYLYDAVGNVTCTVQYMDNHNWGPQASSCTPLQTTGPYGPDRVTQTTYDALNRVSIVTKAVGTPDQGVTSTVGYTDNGQKAYVIDGNNNRTSFLYDGFDRPSQVQYPSSSKGVNASNSGDYDAVLAYDANGHPTQTRLRDGTTIGLTYDNLGRRTSRVVQNNVTHFSDYQVNTTYDLLGDVTSISRPIDGDTRIFDYDVLGRFTGERQPFGSISYQLDLNGRRTVQTWSDGFYVNYDYDNLGLVTAVRENGATSGVGVLASYSYDSAARRTAVNFGNGTARYYAYDPISRLTGLQLTFPNGVSNHVIGGYNGNGTPITYSPANQITSILKSNDGFAYTSAANADRNYNTNGLNQYISDGQVSFGYDGRGNLTSSGSLGFGYNKENELISVSNGTTMYYDPLGRLSEYDTNVSTRFFYAGSAMAAEVSNPDSRILRRYVTGPGTDEPIVWYEGSGTSDRRFLQADERGSITAITDSGGNMINVNNYDEYGIPGPNNIGRFQYTGQAWYGEVGLYNFKARWYSPSLGRFMQTDPIGYGDGLNWHNYAHSDPINGSDPSGTMEDKPHSSSGTDGGGSFIEVPGNRGGAPDTSFTWPSRPSFIGGGVTDNPLNEVEPVQDIVVNGVKPKSPQSKICDGHLPDGGTIRQNADQIRRIVAASKETEDLYSTLDPFGAPGTHSSDLNAFSYWLSAVSPGGKWAGRIGEPGGNWNYGATGRAAGIPLGVLLRGAGAAEQLEGLTGRTGSGNTGQGSPFGAPPYGDNPEGQEQIKQGYNAGC